MHVVKTVVYQKYLDIGLEAFKLGAFIGISMVTGTWVGKKVIERLPKEIFVKLVRLLLVGIGLQLFFGL